MPATDTSTESQRAGEDVQRDSAEADAASDTSRAEAASDGATPLSPRPAEPPIKRSLWERIEARLSRLSAKSNFWHRVCSLIWLPYAFKSGIKMKRLGHDAFVAVLPFRRFNRNLYNAMAGAALLGNCEIAGGMYVFGICGGDYTVVCKHLDYKFLRPCMGPAVYRIEPREDVHERLRAGTEFNLTLDMDIRQQVKAPGARERRVGRAVITFHVTPKAHHKSKRRRRRAAAE